MLVSEYLRKKNALVLKATGVILVPEDQIEECKQQPLHAVSDASVCPYCAIYHDPDGNCAKCPMEKAGNSCIAFTRSQPSYRAVKEAMYKLCNYQGIQDVPGVRTLVDQYNKELKEAKMSDLVLKIYDDNKNVIFEQVFFNVTDEAVIDIHARKLVSFFKADDYETFDWGGDN